jgi:hypothetical protein
LHLHQARRRDLIITIIGTIPAAISGITASKRRGLGTLALRSDLDLPDSTTQALEGQIISARLISTQVMGV